MRIAYIVPGTGGAFYCENCVRDCALISGFRALGHEVTAVPMYLPIAHKEEVSLDGAPLFFGAVRIYLQDRAPFFRLFPRVIQRVFDASPLLSLAASHAGSTRAQGHERMTISMLRGLDGPMAGEFERLVAWITANVRPDAVFLSNALLLGVAQAFALRSGATVACIAHDEHTWVESSPPEYQRRIWEMICEQSAHADVLITLSQWYASYFALAAKVPLERFAVIPFGVDTSRYPKPLTVAHAPMIGYLSRLSLECGIKTLTGAYALLARKKAGGIQLALCGGSTNDDRRFLESCLAQARACGTVCVHQGFGLTERTRFLQSLSVLSVPASRQIALGTFIIEAMAAGVPVVQPDEGGFSEIVESTGGGLLYSPNTPEALADALETALSDGEKLQRLARNGYAAVAARYTHIAMAKAALSALGERKG
jgi:glycosyltransferase involved in cell wall biosynthesis